MQLENYVAISSVPDESGQFWQLALFVITLITRLVLIKKLCLKDVTLASRYLFLSLLPPRPRRGRGRGLLRDNVVFDN